jgi:hypothetical protein
VDGGIIEREVGLEEEVGRSPLEGNYLPITKIAPGRFILGAKISITLNS